VCRYQSVCDSCQLRLRTRPAARCALPTTSLAAAARCFWPAPFWERGSYTPPPRPTGDARPRRAAPRPPARAVRDVLGWFCLACELRCSGFPRQEILEHGAARGQADRGSAGRSRTGWCAATARLTHAQSSTVVGRSVGVTPIADTISTTCGRISTKRKLVRSSCSKLCLVSS